MNNFSVAVLDQKLIVPQVNNMLTYRKFTFERDISMEADGETYHVNCMAAHNMSAKRPEWKTLPRHAGYFGVFLLRPPSIQRI